MGAGLRDVDPADAMAQLIDRTDPKMLSKAVQCAELLGGLAGALRTFDESREEQHWQNRAAFVPPFLLFASMLDNRAPSAGMDMLLEILTSPAAGAVREKYIAARGSDELTTGTGRTERRSGQVSDPGSYGCPITTSHVCVPRQSRGPVPLFPHKNQQGRRAGSSAHSRQLRGPDVSMSTETVPGWDL